MLWSILISGIPERFHSVQPLLYNLLESQAVARRPEVELLYALDNKRRSVGAKRNALIDSARGEYVSFIDDDDDVASDYVQKIVAALAKGRKMTPPVDVVCFGQRATILPHNVTHECSYSLANFKDRKPEERRQLQQSDVPGTFNWSGPPAHTMVWRRAIMDGIRFEERMFGEDTAFVDKCCEKAQTEMRIEGPPLYFYRFNEATTATRG